MSDTKALADEALLLLKAIAPFDSLPEDELDRIAAGVTEMRVSPGDPIVREGEQGDALYLIASGSVQVVARAFDGSDVVLARLEAGQFFGEQALLPGGTRRRSASVRAISHGRLLSLTRDSLLQSLDADSLLARSFRDIGEKQKELRTSQLREEVLRKLGVADGYQVETYPAGDWVFRQGDPGDRLFLILAGSARVLREDADGETELAELLPGQFFGELAVLEDKPRGASVRADGELEVVSLDASWFRSAVADHPQLRSVMSSLKTMYMLPARGVLTLQSGKLGTQPTLTAVYHMPDGRQVVTTRLVAVPAFTARVIGSPEATQSARYVDDDGSTMREIHLADGRIVEIESDGPWDELGRVLEFLLDEAALAPEQLTSFRASGDLSTRSVEPTYDPNALICRCSNISARQLNDAIDSGCRNLDELSKATNAGLICGGCMPNLRGFLGKSDWTPAQCESVTPLTDEIRAFRIRPQDGSYQPNLPGQHLVVQARIGEHWVQRPYTISSSSEDGYEITVKREGEGVFSRWLFDHLAPETVLRISRPSGDYYLASDYAGEVVCLVGGIGITPALAIASALAADRRPVRLHIDYSVSAAEQAVRCDELAALARSNPLFTLNLRVTSRQGRLDPTLIQALVDTHPGALFYLCASPAYVDRVQQYLRDAGVDEARIKVEQFTIAGETVRKA